MSTVPRCSADSSSSAGGVGARAASALVWITVITAVPIEAPTCWMMFSVVLARAIAALRSVCSAPAMIGIIVTPMPRTNSPAPSAQRRETRGGRSQLMAFGVSRGHDREEDPVDELGDERVVDPLEAEQHAPVDQRRRD